MGGVLDSIFGGSDQSSSSESGNSAYPWVKQNFGSTSANAYNGGMGALGSLLGLGGDQAASSAALDNFWKSSGGDFLLNKGVGAINSNMYSRGLGQSGANEKALEGYRSGLASTQFNNILQDYMGMAKLGLGGGSLVSDSGQYSKSNSSGSSSSGGLGSFLGAALAFL